MPRSNPFERRPLLDTLRPWGAFAFLAIVFVLFSAWLWRPLLRDADSTRWPATEAVVTASGTFACKYGHEATLWFAWTVDGRYHGSGHESFASACGSAAVASALAASYPVGRRVEIHYDPARPELAVVRAGVYTRSDRVRLVAIELLLLLMLTVAWWRYARGERD